MSESVSELRQQLHQAAVDCAYWRGRAEALERFVDQRSAPGGTNLPPELLAPLLMAKLKEKKDAQEGV